MRNALRSLFSFLFVLSIAPLIAQQTVIVDAGMPVDSSTRFMQGFLHGGPSFADSSQLAKLKPEFWRIGAYVVAGSGYEDVQPFEPEIMLVLNDLYMIQYNIPSQTQSQPWVNNWADWDALVSVIVNNVVSANAAVAYWDVWGEPDNFWTGTPAQFIEMHRRTDSIIHSIDPTAKIAGPEFAFANCNFSVQPLLDFLDQLYLVNATVDAVSWHEFCQPEDIPVHVQELRDSLAVRPWLGNLAILITEYGAPGNQVIPGWNAGWLYYLEKAKVDWASHACWDESDGLVAWSDCEKGMNGLFMSDHVTPQPNYWLHRAYAELGDLHYVTSGTSARCLALAGTDTANQEMKIIVGRYDNPNLGQHNAPIDVTIKIVNYSYCTSCTLPFLVQRIPSNNVPYSVPLLAPQLFSSGTIAFTGDSAQFALNGFVDGDVYILYINPTQGSILGNEEITEAYIPFSYSITPHPFAIHSTLTTSRALTNATLIWYNSVGQAVKTMDNVNGTSVELYRENLSAGMYFLQVSEDNRMLFSEKVLLID